MKWNIKTKSLLEKSLKSNRRRKSGVSCIFYPILDYGAKIYKNKRQRNRCFNLQKIANEYFLAPSVGDRFEIEIDGKKFFGFFTQKVRVLKYSDHFYDEKLGKKLKQIGINHYDLHSGNIGIIKRKRVCIDFDSLSCVPNYNIIKQRISQ